MLLLIVLLLAEAALVVYRVRTQSIQRRAAVIIRGASFLVLVMLSAYSVITWGFRYYALAAVLLISAAVSAVQLLRNRNRAGVTTYHRVRAIRKAVGMSVLLIAALLPAILFPEYRALPTTGEYRVATVTKHFRDESRIETYAGHGGARTLAAEFWYPAGTAGSFPLVVFSHGSFGTRTSNETLFRELASHGYVICSIDHTYQCFYTTDELGNGLLISGEYFNEILRENAREDKQNSLELYRKWMGVRVADIDFMIDVIKADSSEKADAPDTLFRMINAGQIGVMGHSLGGAAALGVGRLRSDVGAVVALEAPYMCDILGVENDTFVFESAAFPVPVLNIYSDSSWTHLAEWPQYGKNAELLAGADTDAYNIHIAGVGHLSLTDLSLASPILTRILDGCASSLSAEDCLYRINEECLAFFNARLKGQGMYDQGRFG